MSFTRSTLPRRAVTRALFVATVTLATTVISATGAAAVPTIDSDVARGVGEVSGSGS